MDNLFDVVPENFFYVLTGNNKREIIDNIFIIYESMNTGNAFRRDKGSIINDLSGYYARHIVDFDDEEVKSPIDKARYVYTRLRSCGWLSEDIVRDGISAYFEDYAISMIESFINLERQNDVEYTSMIYTIYQALSNFDITMGASILEVQYKNTIELFNRLKNLNTNIKKYILRLLDEDRKDDLNKLLEYLLSEYQSKIVDRALYNLTVKDNPAKYRIPIMNKLEEIRDNDEIIEIIINQVMDTKEKDYNEARYLVYEEIRFIIDSFNNIKELVDDIKAKQTKFVSLATKRIEFLLNAGSDLEAKINDVLKAAKSNDDVLENVGRMNKYITLEDKSLLTPMIRRNVKIVNVLEDSKVSEEVRLATIEKIRNNAKYTSRNIEKFVLDKLDKKEEILASEIFKDNDDIALFVLILMYGFNPSISYELEPTDEMKVVNYYRFREYKIRRRKING